VRIHAKLGSIQFYSYGVFSKKRIDLVKFLLLSTFSILSGIPKFIIGPNANYTFKNNLTDNDG